MFCLRLSSPVSSLTPSATLDIWLCGCLWSSTGGKPPPRPTSTKLEPSAKDLPFLSCAIHHEHPFSQKKRNHSAFVPAKCHLSDSCCLFLLVTFRRGLTVWTHLFSLVTKSYCLDSNFVSNRCCTWFTQWFFYNGPLSWKEMAPKRHATPKHAIFCGSYLWFVPPLTKKKTTQACFVCISGSIVFLHPNVNWNSGKSRQRTGKMGD